MSGVERAGGHPQHDDRASARHLASAGAQIAQGRADVAYRAWVTHMRDCRDECRTQGRDCEAAARLRGDLRAAREAGARP